MLPLLDQLQGVMKKSGLVRFAAIFGSCLDGSSDRFSDIDLLVVCKEDDERKAIQGDVLKLSHRMGRTIHLNDYIDDEFKMHLKHHDYKLASILEGSLLLIGDEDYVEPLKLFEGSVDEKSIAFNEARGVKVLNRALENLEKFEQCAALSSHHPELLWRTRYFQSLCIRDSHFALGYLLASQRMKRTGNVTTLRELLSEGTPLMRTLISIDKRNKRVGGVSLRETEECVLKVRSEYAKITT